jgi:hypothetical protein
MADHPELHGVIRLEDQGSEALRQVAAEIHKVAAQAAKAGHAINHMHHEGVLSALREHTEQVGESFGRLHESIGHVHEGLTDLLPAIAAVTAVASLGGVFEMVAEQAEKMESLEHTAAIIGITAHELQRMHYAAQQTGTSTEAMDKGLERLNRNLAEAAHGHNKMVAAALKHAGIKLFDDSGHIRTAMDILPDFSAALARTGNEAVRAENAMLFMGRAGQELLPVLTMGAEKQREMNAEFEHFHPMGKEGTAALTQYAEGLKQVQSATDGFKESMAASMAPILLPWQHDLAEFLAHQSQLAKVHQGIGGFLEAEGKKIESHLDHVDWAKQQANVEGFGGAINGVIGGYIGWDHAAEAVAALMAAKAGMWALSPVIAFGGVLGKVTKSVWALSEAWRGVEVTAGAAEVAEGAAALGAAGVAAAALAAAGTLAWAYKANSDAYHDYEERRHSEKDVKHLVNDVRDHYLDMSPEHRAEFRAHQQAEIAAEPVISSGRVARHAAYDGYVITDDDEAVARQRDLFRFAAPHLPDFGSFFQHDTTPFLSGAFASPIGADGHNPFANPVFPDQSVSQGGFQSDGARPWQPVKVEGDYTLHLELANLPAGTIATLTPNGGHPNGPHLNLGSYDSSH